VLPVRQRVVFKIAGLMHQSLVGAAAAYLADDCRLLSDVGRRPLRSNSNDTRKLLVPPTQNKLGVFVFFCFPLYVVLTLFFYVCYSMCVYRI